jgi:peptidoglycan hydrolase-like protein with peptidoglycan-binding domain
MLKRLLFTATLSMFAALGVSAQGGSSPAPTTGGPSASAPKTKTAVFRPTKAQIKQGQTALKDGKLYTGEATGVYNDATRAAIRSYQKANGLEINGKFDPATLQKMNISASAPVASSTSKSSSSSTGPKRPAPFRANVDQIKAAQKLMKDGKMYDGEQSGKLDDATRAGLKKYQAANSVEPTGTLNAVTLEKMGVALTDAQKANVAAQAAYEAAIKKTP